MAKTYKIAFIPGDGTGPEVVKEAVKVINAAASKGGFKLEFTEFDFGAARYLKTGETLPDSAIGEFKKFDSMFLGAIGHPDVKPGILEAGILLKIRFALDQYINLRPVKLYPNVETPLKDKGPEDIDFVVIRENTGGIYTGHGGATRVGTSEEIATQLMVYDRRTVDRCLKYAFELKRKRNAMNPEVCGKADHAHPQAECADPLRRPLVPRLRGDGREAVSRTSSETTTISMRRICGS